MRSRIKIHLTMKLVAGLGLALLSACGPEWSVSAHSPGSTGSHASSSTGTGTTGHASTTATASASGTTTSGAGSTASTTATSTSAASTSAASTASGTTGGAASTTTTAGSTGTTGATDCCNGACTNPGVSCDATLCQCVLTSASCQAGAVGSGVPADAIDLSTVTILNSPDVTTWPATTALTTLNIQSSGFHVEFDRQDGSGRWPDYDVPGWNGGNLQYTLWIFEQIGGQWYASGGIEYWYGDPENGGAPSGLGVDWFYDANRWGALANRQPAVGELVGFMVSAGDARNNGGTLIQERSNIVMVPFPSDTGWNFSCPAAAGTGTTSGGSTGGSTGGTTTGGGTTGSAGGDCCSGACDPATQFCDPASCQCQAQGSLALSQATVYDSPADVANWPVTTSITRLDIESSGFHVEFGKQDGPDRWPDNVPPGWTGPLQYTLWSVEYINGAWAASGPIEYWYGLYESGGAPSGFAADWYYDGRWGPLANYQPAVGEWVGFFVTAGNARNVLGDDTSQAPVMERSNIVVVPFPSDTGHNYTF